MVALGLDPDLLENLQPRLDARLDCVYERAVEIKDQRAWRLEIREFAQRRLRTVRMVTNATITRNTATKPTAINVSGDSGFGPGTIG